MSSEPPQGARVVVRVDRDRLRRQRQALELSVVVDSFADFVARAWHVVEPTRTLVHSYAVEGMCAAAQAVGEGRIRRLIVETCPGTAKSLVWAVLFPAWLFLRRHGQARIMVASYAWTFAMRDSDRCRRLIQSDWYQTLLRTQLGEAAWQIREDANRKDDWWTTAEGRRLIASVAGRALGERCTLQLIDDPLKSIDAYSKNAKDEAARWIDEVLTSRLEDQRVDQRVLIAQRLARDDPSGRIKERNLGWRVISLPVVLGEDDVPCELRDDNDALVWRDPRGPDMPVSALFDLPVCAELRETLGSAAYNAQYRQHPDDESESMFPRSCFTRRWTELPKDFDRIVIALDANYKAGIRSDYAVIQCWGAKGGDRYLIEQWRKQADAPETLREILAMANRWPYAKVLIESAANGHAVFQFAKQEIAGVVDVYPAGGKATRASSVQGVIESGAVVLPEHARWVGAWLDEVCSFSGAKTIPHDDQVDAMVYALRDLQAPARTMQSVPGMLVPSRRR